MSSVLKVSGKSVSLPEDSQFKWKFTSRPGGWVIAESGAGHRYKIMVSEVRGFLSVSLSGRLWCGEWMSRVNEGRAKSGEEDLVAQFPGKVRKVLVTAGSQVEAGDPLLLVEAMKMEFTIRAPFAGQLKSVYVVEGQQISAGERFLDLEARGG